MAAATLPFLTVLGVIDGILIFSRSGQTFSSCLRFAESRDSKIIAPFAGQIPLNFQKTFLAASRTAGLVSVIALRMHLSRTSKVPEVSMALLARRSWTSR